MRHSRNLVTSMNLFAKTAAINESVNTYSARESGPQKTHKTLMKNRMLINRREMLKGVGGATASILAAPMINRGRFRLFAGSMTEYSSKTVELIGRSTV